ncbi:hypothetical protein QJ856_gp0138 [Tupanvirus deep ocean]|uniref:Uncharacterized protein n=2 Tax=Tupanvirus TaxID=2094720 RepID=A0AC62AA01_9VIRU|nr:hypothetical protein QJ856_gp0138 [Tupanvirus deep ocean]QKU34589.1 hypothetical protein [Tupanvirus deep ocean]
MEDSLLLSDDYKTVSHDNKKHRDNDETLLLSDDYKTVSHDNKKHRDNDETLLLLNKNNKKGIHYGYMWYTECNIMGFRYTNYEIFETSDDFDKIIFNIQQILIRALEKNYSIKLMLYQVEDVDPRLVSYNIIKSSNLPWCTFKINGKRNFVISGIPELYKKIYPKKINLVHKYHEYIISIESLEDSSLKNIYEKVFNKKASFIINGRSKILKQLIKYKKFELMEAYKQS